MPSNTVGNAFQGCWRCLFYPLNKHPLLCYKAFVTLMQGISNTLNKHRYKRTPDFAMSRWQLFKEFAP